MREPGRPAHQLRRQLLADESGKAGRRRRRQRHQLEARQHRTLRQFELAREIARRAGGDAAALQRRRRVGGRARGESDAARALARLEEIAEPARTLRRIDQAEQLDVVAWKHDAVIAGALLQMPPARRQREAQPLPPHARPIEIGDRDQHMIDAG